MGRDLTPAMATAITQGNVPLALFFEAEFYDESAGALVWVRLWSGYTPVEWDGKSWAPGGSFVSLSNIEDGTDVVSSGITVTLSGLDEAVLSLAINAARHGATGFFYLAVLEFDGAGLASILDDPVTVFGGRLDTSSARDSGSESTVFFSYEDGFADMNEAALMLYTHSAQLALFPGDRGLQRVASYAERVFTWGTA